MNSGRARARAARSARARVPRRPGRPDGVRDIHGRAAAVIGVPIGLLSLLLWWWLTPPILRGYARLSGKLLGPTGGAALAARVRHFTESRAEAVDAQAAELRRIERDLHDGAQARLVSLGMNLGMAEELLRTVPERAAALLAEAKADSDRVLVELRSLVRGIHPPVLADRGLGGAVQALAPAHPPPVRSLIAQLLGRRRRRLNALTPREREVLALMAEGRTNAAIAARLFITEKAVGKHINNVFCKLELPESADDNRRVLAVPAYLRA